ncbi:MAG: valine--tRNA ligase [Dehalococcoidales bacterium]|nr:valine--tRNA ligase [Dehalococcoidales bacterium]
MDKLPKRYNAAESEIKWRQYWEDRQVYRFSPDNTRPVFSIDTPPPTVSGDLHMGHCYSYSQPDFYARFHRMNGKNVFYPMGFDDNGLPTERLVESHLGITPESVGTETFLKEISRVSRQLEEEYKTIWQKLGLSIDWDFTYTTISPESHKTAQYSFIDLFNKDRIYRSSSPTIWCPSCKTAIANAEVTDLQRNTSFITIPFRMENGDSIPIATTRPELLPACVAVFVNPSDSRYQHIIGQQVTSPLFNKQVPVLPDPKADPEKGTGIVMCCTFGDTTDIKWWREYNLPVINIIGADGCLNSQAGFLEGMEIRTAHEKIIEELHDRNLVLNETAASQTVSVHERCDTPVEYVETRQWFVRIMDRKEELLEAGRKITWHPGYMLSRYEDWINNLEWDWCISRQRYHGVPFPVWYCTECGKVILADSEDLPIDPRSQLPGKPCACGSNTFTPETSVMDTWMTSSLTPQIAGKWLDENGPFNSIFPMSLRPQAHDIIRTWAFYTIVKSVYHLDDIPWADIAISGHGLSPEGHKVSKSRGNNVSDPMNMMEKYSADAVRYWAASSRLGEDSLINEEKIAVGQKLVTKLWNVTRFSYPFLQDYTPPKTIQELIPTDRWLLSGLQHLIDEVTDSFSGYDHLSAKNRIENYFWNPVADNYLEMVKSRLYDMPDGSVEKESAKYTLYLVLFTLIRLLAPVMPYITEEMYRVLFKEHGSNISVHLSDWPRANADLINEQAEQVGKSLVEIASAVRRYKSEKQLPVSTPLKMIEISAASDRLPDELGKCIGDIKSVTRAERIVIEQNRAGQLQDMDIRITLK